MKINGRNDILLLSMEKVFGGTVDYNQMFKFEQKVKLKNNFYFKWVVSDIVKRDLVLETE